ncbi:MAG TPA: type II toxin-antitoxin system RelE/ParE family toxin [Acidobacteriaceae bacterium]|nr:type II toxin-antitoxin system RelE/ParE family toxin [Acidobacteriaceae bacterium]
MPEAQRNRTFRTAWFTRAARKAHISDEELCTAILQVIAGQADDLGGGVFKKRLRKNQYRSIILTRTRHFWVYEYLFAKQDRANIEDDELVEFRKLARAYAGLTTHQVSQLLRNEDWMEICNDNQT